MLQAQLLEPGRVELRQVPVPEPAPGELIVRVEAALTCGTDLKLFRRGHPKLPTPAPFGHEFSGTVAALGATTEHAPEQRLREGDAVALVPTAPCGGCEACRRGRENLCPDALADVVLGAFAEYVRVPARLAARHVFPRPPSLSAAEAAALEPLSCVVHGAARVRLDRAEHVVILGDGPIALLFLQLARAEGAGRVSVLGHHDRRLAAARELGADEAVRAPDAAGDAPTADLVIECVGTPDAWERAASLAAPGGEILFFGGCAAGTRASFDTYRVHYEELTLKGAFHYGTADVRRALAHLASGAVRAAPLITHTRPLQDLEEALRLALEREAIKVEVRIR